MRERFILKTQHDLIIKLSAWKLTTLTTSCYADALQRLVILDLHEHDCHPFRINEG